MQKTSNRDYVQRMVAYTARIPNHFRKPFTSFLLLVFPTMGKTGFSKQNGKRCTSCGFRFCETNIQPEHNEKRRKMSI